MEKETESFEDCRKKTPEQIEQERLQAQYREVLVGTLGEKAISIFTAQEAVTATEKAIEDVESQKMPNFIVDNSECIVYLHEQIDETIKNGDMKLNARIEDNTSYSAYDKPEMAAYFESLGYDYKVDTRENSSRTSHIHYVDIDWTKY